MALLIAFKIYAYKGFLFLLLRNKDWGFFFFFFFFFFLTEYVLS